MLDNVVRQVTESLRARAAAAPAPMALAAVQARARDATEKKRIPVSRVFLTAEALLRRLSMGDDGDTGHGEPTRGQRARLLTLAPNEHLTPAAKDVVDERRLTVRRTEAPVGRPAGAPGGDGPACGAGVAGGRTALGMVIERPSTKVTSALSGLARDGVTVINYTQTDCWIQNTLLMCQAIGGGTVGAGVLVLPYAVDAMVLANKVPGIRAVQGVGAESVAAARRHYAANVLVLEHAVLTLHELRMMIHSFSRPAPVAPAAKVLMEAVAKLEGK